MKSKVSLWLGLLMVPSLFAQTIVLTSPSTNMSYAAGDEFATSVAANPWDMNQIRDIPYDINFQEPTAANNEWSSTFLAAGAPFYPLWRGFSTATAASYPYHVDNCMPLGQLNPINASKYSRLSMRISTRNRSTFWVIWTTNAAEVENPVANAIGFIDGDCLLQNEAGQWTSELYPEGYRIYELGFNVADYFNDRINNPSAGVEVLGPWTNNIYGFLIEATKDGAAGTAIKVNWMRLYDPSTSPKLQLRWYTTGADTNDLTTNSVQVCVVTNRSIFNGELVATCLKNDGLYEINTAAFPPGDYYFYLQLVARNSSAYRVLGRSGYSAKVTITHPPELEFTAPTFTSGSDYATVELGNPWDMTDSSDIYEQLYLSNVSFDNGMLIATADAPILGNESDAQFYLNTRLSGEFKAIDASKYRYLTYRMMVDPTGYVNINDWVAKGWLPRVIWFNTSITNDGSEAQGIPMLESWHSYTVDLADRALLTTENPYPAQLGWRELGSVKRIRFDPLEVPVATTFAIDDIKLCDDNRPANNSYTISWTATDPDSASVTVSLYYGTLSGSSFSGHLLTTVTQAVGSASYVWDSSAVGAGSYYIQAIITDGDNSITRITKVPVVVGGATDNHFSLANATPLGADFDGDRVADPALYQASSGGWQVRLSSTGYALIDLPGFFGGPGYTAFAADFDGDRVADPAVYRETTGDWQVKLSGGGYSTLNLPAFMGGAGYAAVAADFDGDRLADPAVYGEATGDWEVKLSGSGYSALSLPAFMGGAGYVALAADFDGDGLADPAGYQQGNWNIKFSHSGYSQETKAGYLGLDGYSVLAADFDGDSLADYAAYDAVTGIWLIRLSSAGYVILGMIL
ncbi:MAG: hypothetical protein WC299_05570 [Kiritimatiellia bacterium]